ncbi:tRNA (N(6)-L-threonylcarbamoyladenosine(37)-C(2))-methylthiotransferase MtaB [Ancylobacter dichloromethanicus]|uniref:tRNA (N(6)-L-threonylcarbamoyladenosine(37)-C(2))-methylthiotransferase MtaB n=1 Tax=Ancylobacter dichloromethanicus TaxID=518825 RepID=A0A9W6J911_9HYPH|nr:tRNA (N(6)-L-threonylcarbamoyladenosine(37)-C(2))-methylthiotransferase MtaB [Ancylobacter dichloromethanicus]MBS7553342.1 tRNA (N(6)-L-threonylcarbamoyladenosine(37)-C(2))-methylthiotransferase MtaB [Ancylobacter dichloromethanicus]GLK73125.1 tRNA (N(6)-L-threonylcarbamoyladenosine(37)-C(2))-methylthiotransferase MtaB [Ancylobacter dichloromethanicus]
MGLDVVIPDATTPAAPVEVVTFGCRLNALDSATAKAMAGAAGLENVVVVNTCAVTAEAVKQARQAIRRLKREAPARRIIVTGCAAQTEPGRFAAMDEVDRVLGNAEKTAPESWAATRAALDFGIGADAKTVVGDIMAVRETAGHLIDGPADTIEGHTRAFVQVQDGCDHRCTFCVIPYGRGNSRSVPMGAVVARVRELVADGTSEIVLTGVDLTSYGADLPGAPRLGTLVRALLRHVPELPRLRLSSIDSVEVDAELLRALAEEERLMPHLHLSLQAGDDLILKRMKRRHLRADAIRFCADIRRMRPDMVIGADLIAGFPTETEAQFRASLDLVDACGLTHLHVFPFSPRPGTPAARMPAVAPATVKERARRLREKGAHALLRHLAGEIGARREVLAERGGLARTRSFTPVRLPTRLPPGTLTHIRIAGHDGVRLIAA